MITLGIYLLVFLFAGLPYDTIVKWLNNINSVYKSPVVPTLFPPLLFNTYLIATCLKIIAVFFTLKLSYNYFYFDEPFYFIVAVACIVCSFFWSVFNKFKSVGASFYFFIGFYAYFSWIFLLILPLIYILFSILFNHRVIRNLFVIISCFLAPLLFEVGEYFIASNSIFLSLFFLRHLNGLDNYFSKNATTLLKDFNRRSVNV